MGNPLIATVEDTFMKAFTLYLNPKRLLIEPCDRLRFATSFMMFATLAVWVGLWLSHRINFFPGTSLRNVLISGWGGALLGTVQWTLLRRYIPSARWIIAAAVGAIITTGGGEIIHSGIVQIWQGMAGSSTAINSANAPTEPPLEIFFLSSVLATPLFLGTGLLQWLVLRRYVAQITWWIIFPLFIQCLLLAMNILCFYYVDPTFGSAWGLNIRMLGIGIEQLAYAVAFCTMVWGKAQSQQPLMQGFNTAPEVRNFRMVRTLGNHLRRQINQSWISELSSSEPLVYLIGVNQSGKIVNSRPKNAVSAHKVRQTPISQLMSSSEETKLGQAPLARFLVTFNPKGSFSIRSCRSISLGEVISVLIPLLLLISFYSLWLEKLFLWAGLIDLIAIALYKSSSQYSALKLHE
jgi:hypothetical protein